MAAFSHEKFLSFNEAKDLSGFTIKFREDPIFLDPRNKKLGARLIINLEKLHLSLKKLELKSSEKEILSGKTTVAVKVVDIFGNDTMKVLKVKI